MLRLLHSREYLARYRSQYQKLYAGDAELYRWPTRQSSLFRARDWQIAPLAADPWRVMPVAPGQAVDWNESSKLNPNVSVEDAYRQHLYRRFWLPWSTLLKERKAAPLLLSTYELLCDHEPCCAECGLDWTEIGDGLRAIDYHVADAFALFSMCDD